MAKMNQNQSSKIPNEGTVDEKLLTVKYWRERFKEDIGDSANLLVLAERLGGIDQDFKGTQGYFRLQRINAGRGGLSLTAKAVRLLAELTEIKE